MVRKQQGFTIIELVVVIVILGILAAVAFPKFQDLSGDAKTAVVNGHVASLKSAAVISYAKNQGSKASFASILSQVSYDTAVVTIAGPCNDSSVKYGNATPQVVSIDLSEYCSG